MRDPDTRCVVVHILIGRLRVVKVVGLAVQKRKDAPEEYVTAFTCNWAESRVNSGGLVYALNEQAPDREKLA